MGKHTGKLKKRIEALFLTGILVLSPLEVMAETWEDENVSTEFTAEGFAENLSEEEFVSEDSLTAENWSSESIENGEKADSQDGIIEELYDSGEVLSGAIASDGEDSGIALFSLDYYTDSYGAQLDENAKALYDLLVQNYVVNYSEFMDSVNFTFEFPEKITFEAVVEDGAIQKTVQRSR